MTVFKTAPPAHRRPWPLPSCGGGGSGAAVDYDFNVRPSYLNDLRQASYDGAGNDLLTGGLGRSGLQDDSPPGYAGSQPTAEELRRNAIYVNYRALVDTTSEGGYGRLYGPNVDAQGRATSGEGMVAGTEAIAYSDDGSGAPQCHSDGAGAGCLRPHAPLHHHRHLVRLARHLRRHSHGRMGPQARLRRWPIRTRARAPRPMTCRPIPSR